MTDIPKNTKRKAAKRNEVQSKTAVTLQIRGELTGILLKEYRVTETVIGRMCACGCQQPIPETRRADCQYLSDAHRKRAMRKADRNREHKCLCGCGKTITGNKKSYYSNACRQRRYRALKAEEIMAL